jgi:CheY-like chemotaxis protein
MGMIPAAFDSPETTLENLAFGHEYDLVLLDFCMPKTNGCDLAKKLSKCRICLINQSLS